MLEVELKMVRNIKLQVFLDLKLYNDLKEYAKNLNMQFRSDSDMIYKLLFHMHDQVLALDLQIYVMKQQIEKLKSIMESKNLKVGDDRQK